jgi:very-short-patch-repair endonuclease
MSDPQRARILRRNMSPAERRLWRQLRTRPGGFKFRSQHPNGSYTLDFFCHSAALAIEIDGVSHDMGGNPARDEQRDAVLAAKGVKTLRFLATDIRDHLEGVIARIVEECVARCPLHHASHGPPPPEIRGRKR